MQLHEVINNLNKDISNKSRFSFKKLKEILINEFGINDRREVIKDPSLLNALNNSFKECKGNLSNGFMEVQYLHYMKSLNQKYLMFYQVGLGSYT